MPADARSPSKAETTTREGGSLSRRKNVYRLLAFAGLVVLTGLAVGIVTTVDPQRLPGIERLFGSRQAIPSTTSSPVVLGATAVVTVLAALPLCKPRPRRILDMLTATVRSLLIVIVALATVGYFTTTLRLPRTTLLLYAGVLAATLPAWFVLLQQRQLKRAEGTLVVGNNPDRIEAAVQAAAEPIAGYAFSPTDSHGVEGDARADGGGHPVPEKLAQYECLGGLSRLDDILERSDVGTVIPALPQTDRAEFFGVLETCHRHNVSVEILTEHNESVLVEDESAISSKQAERLIGINMEPLDLQNRVFKRLFDVAFASVGLLVLLCLFVPIAIAIKLDSRGPVIYKQERTTQFGDRFPVYKFRSMEPESEAAAPGDDEDRITRVGRFLRWTHLDELPQVWAIVTGQMSVVGPRAAWTAEEEVIQREMATWKKRWFVKPGLTGLAQINEVSSENSRAKLQYDLTYIRNQSFWFDTKIVIRQLWMVVRSLLDLVRRSLVERP